MVFEIKGISLLSKDSLLGVLIMPMSPSKYFKRILEPTNFLV
jgi:hypothetical protein